MLWLRAVLCRVISDVAILLLAFEDAGLGDSNERELFIGMDFPTLFFLSQSICNVKQKAGWVV